MMNQKKLNEYLADTNEFWTTFHISLKAPFSFFNEFKNLSKKGWASECKKTKECVGF